MLRASLLTACAAIVLASCTDLPDHDDPRDFASDDGSISCADLLHNGDFDDGTVSWEANAVDIINDDSTFPPETIFYAHSGNHFAWLGGVPSTTRKLSQRVNGLPRASALRLKGKYFVASESLNRVEDKLVIEVVEIATGRVLATPISLSNVTPTRSDSTFSWKDLSLDIGSEHSSQPFLLRLTSSNDGANNTNFLFDTLTLKPSSCP